MKKIATFWAYLTLQIMALFTSGMLMTFINDALQSSGFFDDSKRVEPSYNEPRIDIWHDWGIRHYWYFWMMVLLFILVWIRIIMWINWFWSDENKKKY